MELANRARFYGRVVNVLYGKKSIRGRLVTAARGARHLSLGIRLADPLHLDTALSLAEPLALATQTPAVIAARRSDRAGLVWYQFELQSGYWKSYTRKDVAGLGLGVGESNRQIDFSFDDAPHAGVFGTTDSGKSETVRSILAALMTTYKPDALGAVVIDPHADFADDFRYAAHLAAPIATDAEAIRQTLAWCSQELARRREHNQRDARRLVVVIDEADRALLADPGNLAIAQAIGAEARKFNMNLVISTQKPNQKKLPNLLDQLGNRFVGLVTDARASVAATGHAGLSAHLLTGHGDFVHCVGATVERLQVALVTRADLDGIPRGGNMDPPRVEPEDTPRAVNLPPSNDKGGRPSARELIEPRAVAYYLHVGPGNVSRSRADEVLGLKRTMHEAHRDFAIELANELERLEVNRD